MRSITHLGLMFCLFGVTSLAVAEDSRDELVQLLPANTRFLIRVADGKRWVEDFETTSIHRVMYSRAFSPLRDHLGIGDDDAKALSQAGLRTKDIRQLAQGELVLARVDREASSLPKKTRGNATPGESVSTERATATAFRVDSKTAEKVIGEIRSKGSELGARERVIERVGKGSFMVELAWPSPRSSWIYSYANGVFSVCDAVWLSEKLRASGGDTISQNGAFRQIMARTKCPEDGIEVEWFALPWSLVEASETKSQLIRQGFGGIAAMGGRLCLLPDKTVHRSFISARRPLERSASGLSFVSAGVPDVPEWMDGVSSCLATRLDFSAAFRGYGHWFDETHGGGEDGLFDAVLEDIRDEPGSPRVDIRKNLVEQLEGPLLSLVVSLANGSESPEARVFAVRVKNSAIVQKAVDGLLAGDEDVQSMQIEENPAWKFGDLSHGGTKQVLGPDLSGLCLCLARGYFIVAPREDALRTILNSGSHGAASSSNAGESKTLAGQLENAAKQLGVTESIGLGCSLGLGPIGRLYERVVGVQAQKDANAMAIPELLKMFHIEATDQEIRETRAKLPKVSDVAKLFGGSVDAVQESEEGWLVQGIIWSRSP